MASRNIIDDVNLIDLENGISASCVPRVTIVDATPDEQEHLLDVCPPKLEQKLSLTRKNHDLVYINERDISGNILVTLGHDQVVPVRKRIDVVSSDTIKRVRDITKNLEPVINTHTSSEVLGDSNNCVDFNLVLKKSSLEDDISFETREINDAFNFLSELEDNDEKFEPRNSNDYEKILRSSKLRASRYLNKENISYPLEPTCLIEDSQIQSKGISSFVFDNKAFESSPPSKISESAKRPTSLNIEFEGLRNARNSFKRLRSFTCSAVGLDVEPWRKKSKSCFHRKSWSEDCSILRSKCAEDLVKRRNRNKIDSDNPNSARKEKLSFKRQSVPCVGPSSSFSASSATSTSKTCSLSSSISSSSSCSGVDWSWVEEIEMDCCGKVPPSTPPPPPPPDEVSTAHQRQDDERQRERRCSSPTGIVRMRVSCLASRANSDASIAMSVAAVAKNVIPAATDVASDVLRIVDTHQLRGSNVTENNGQCTLADVARVSATPSYESNSGTLPWLRTSMRRLRQFRLADNSPSTLVNVSAPNSLPDIALIAPEILAAQTNDTTGSLLRPTSAPAPVRNGGGSVDVGLTTTTMTNITATSASVTATNSPRRGRRSVGGRFQQRQIRQSAPSSVESTSTCASSTGIGGMSSSASSTSSTPISSQHQATTSTSTRRLCDRQRDGDREDERGEDDDEDDNPLGKWPHALSPALACLGCTLGLFNISRFAILSIQFGANFIVQFLILSFIIGIPLLTLQVCLGQRLAAGAVDMWKISPLFQGVGIALLTAQAFIGIYSIVGVSWMFVYFRDSFITKQDRYRWAEPFALYREDIKPTSSSNSGSNSNNNNNNNGTSYKLHETVPDYFSGTVLQRHHLNEPDPGVVTLKFQVAFNLAVVWMIVFVSLSKGLRSYGKVVYVFTLVPIFGTLVLCTKLLGLTPPGTIHQLFPATVWAEFFINGRSWITASCEVFLTWGLLGAAAMQIAAHNKHKHLLQRDTSLVVVLTFVVLLLGAFLANTCVQILKYHGYVYTTSSFERISGYTFMRPYNQPPPPGYSSTPERFMVHASFLVGQRVTRPSSELNFESGYQALRLSTELVPATLAILGTEQVSPFWAVLFYFILILFGIAQQLAIWHCVITGIMAINTKMMKLWETTITFFSCACAYILGLPMATELGIYVVYYLDYTIGGAWWIMVLYLVQVGAVFAVRGRPHTGEAVVAELFPPTGRCLKYWAGPLLSFTWNVVLPITLMVLSITIFKSTGYRELYTYRRTSKDYWAVWARQLGASLQLIPILLIPVVAIIQTCRYLNSGPPDIFDRIQLLYRPSMDLDDQRNTQTQIRGTGAANLHNNGLVTSTTELPFEDPPPKYTPPPSYTTATGARIAKMLRQSFRRSVRRIANVLGEGGSAGSVRHRPVLQRQQHHQQQPPPPDYAAVLVEMNQRVSSRDIAIHVSEVRLDAVTRPNLTDHQIGRARTIDRTIGRRESIPAVRAHHTLDRRPCSSGGGGASTLTAAEVANLLRSSIRRSSIRYHQQNENHAIAGEPQQSAASFENLVEAAAPIGQDSLLVRGTERVLVPPNINKTVHEMENSVSVI